MRRFLPAVTFALAFRVRRVGAFRAPRGAEGELSDGAVPGTPSGQSTLAIPRIRNVEKIPYNSKKSDRKKIRNEQRTRATAAVDRYVSRVKGGGHAGAVRRRVGTATMATRKARVEPLPPADVSPARTRDARVTGVPLLVVATAPRNFTSSAFTSSACVQVTQCGPPLMTTRRAPRTSVAVRAPAASSGTIRSASSRLANQPRRHDWSALCRESQPSS